MPEKRPGLLSAGAVATIVVLVLLAPPGARAGCSHLVTSRADRHDLSGLREALFHDLVAPSEPLPMPSRPRPCSGAFCSGQPAVPAVPAGVTDGRITIWAWYPFALVIGEPHPVLLSVGTAALRPVHRGSGVFHPPRRFMSA